MRPAPAEYDGGSAGPGERATLVRMTLLQRLTRVVPVVVAAALLCWSATLNNDDDCGTIGDCLGLAFDDLFILALAVPAGAVALRLLRVPRVLLHTLAASLLGAVLWGAAGELLRAVDPGRPHDAVLPVWVAVLVGAAAAVAASFVVGPGRGTGREAMVRVAVPLFVVGLTAGSAYASERAAREQLIDELAAAPVTLYAPVIAGQAPEYAYASTRGVRMSYSVDVAGEHAYVAVELVPTPAGPLCAEVVVAAGPECVQQGDTMRNPSETLSDLALVRGDTTLVAQIDAERLDPEAVLQALHDAAVATPEGLA